MKKVLFFALALLAFTACKDDDKGNDGPTFVYTNSYTYEGTSTPIAWAGFFYDKAADGYTIGLGKAAPAGDLSDESDYISFDVAAAALDKTIDVTKTYEEYSNYQYAAYFKNNGTTKYVQEGSYRKSLESGTFVITHTAGTNTFSVRFSFVTDDGKTVSGNYKSEFIECDEYSDVAGYAY